MAGTILESFEGEKSHPFEVSGGGASIAAIWVGLRDEFKDEVL